MAVRVGINGFGRIGRNFFRAAKKAGADIDFVAVNDLGAVDTMAHLLKYDSVLGQLEGEIKSVDGGISVNGDVLQVLSERNPNELPWGDLGVDVVVESTGVFTSRDGAARHLEGGAPFVIVSAPCSGADATFVVGVNEDEFDAAANKVVSNASCTTNCFVPMVKVLDDAFGVQQGLMTTVHAYTGDQALVDGPHSDLRRARGAAINIIPTSTGAARATGLVLQSMQGKLDGTSLRVPVPTGSITDFTAVVNGEPSVDDDQPGLRRRRRFGTPGLGPRLHRGAHRLQRHRHLARLLHPRCGHDHGPGVAGQDLRLVRQRVGLLEPPGRPDHDRRGSQPAMINGVPELEDLGEVGGRSVLVRTDFNVPLDGDRITDDLRIRAALPTLKWLVERGATVTACSHLGRPKGTVDPAYSLDPVRARLAELAPQVALLDNLRYDAGEEGNDPAFVSQLVAGHDLYVNDAFGASHRAHGSIVGPPEHLPSAAGRLLAKEVEVLSGLRERPRRPFVALMGGAKVSDKLSVIEALLGIVDALVVGGGMAFTFLAAQGASVGSSLLEEDMIDTCRQLLASGSTIHLPEDITALGPGGKLFEPEAGGEVRQVGTMIPDGWMGVDIGPGTAAVFGDVILDAGTVLWNGPMGAFEDPRFDAGTRAVAAAMAETRAFTVVGGGDSAAAAKAFGIDQDVDHVSTGGGASLELIEQGDLPGLAALRRAAKRTTAGTTG